MSTPLNDEHRRQYEFVEEMAEFAAGQPPAEEAPPQNPPNALRRPRTPKERVAAILEYQARQMELTARHMAAVLADDEAAVVHAAQLLGAAECVKLWVERLRK